VRQQADQIGKRFASGGRYTEEQFKAGADVKDGPEPAAEEGGGGEEAKSDAVSTNFDPDDNRTLYDRLKEQRDAKQEEWEAAHQFKNQMDHWRLDEDDAAFEEERVDRLNAQRREAERMNQESAEFYKLARERRTTQVAPVSVASAAPPPPRPPPKRPGASLPAALRVVRPRAAEADKPAAAAAPAPAAAAAAPAAASAGAASASGGASAGASLLGLAYGSSSDEEG
jgi:hypothetical protein